MEWLWLLLVPVALVGGFFLVKGFLNLNTALRDLKGNMADLGRAGTDLKKVQRDLDEWRAALDRVRRR